MEKVDYQGLQKMLDTDFEWPMVYMFKFIVPNDNHKIALVEAFFGAEAQITMHASRSDKYISVTAKEVMLNSESVIEIYKKAEVIEGIVML